VKIGADDKKKVIAMAVLLVIAIPLVIHSYNSFSASPSPAASPAPTTATHAPGRTTQKKSGIPQLREGTLDPTLHTDILLASQRIEYTGGKRNIFKMEEAPVKVEPIGPVRTQTPQPPQPNVPPAPPPIPLKFYGFSNRAGEPKKAFLQNGENTFVAVEGDVVDRRYKIVKITNTFVVVEDVLNNNQQKIDLTLPQSS
jgi:hypothetical protein